MLWSRQHSTCNAVNVDFYTFKLTERRIFYTTSKIVQLSRERKLEISLRSLSLILPLFSRNIFMCNIYPTIKLNKDN